MNSLVARLYISTLLLYQIPKRKSLFLKLTDKSNRDRVYKGIWRLLQRRMYNSHHDRFHPIPVSLCLDLTTVNRTADPGRARLKIRVKFEESRYFTPAHKHHQ